MAFELPPVSSISPELLENLIFESALYIIIVLGILAFFGYRLFRYFLVIGGAVLTFALIFAGYAIAAKKRSR